MKFTIIILSMIIVLALVKSQSLDWLEIVSKTQGGMFIRPTFIAADGSNNVYVVKLETVTSPGGTSGSAEILKFDPTGTLLFSKAGPLALNPVGWFDVDTAGNYYITGSGLPTGAPGVFAGFLDKYDPSGNLVYRKTFTGVSMGRAIPLSGGSVRVEVGAPLSVANVYDSDGDLVSSEPLTNVIVSTSVLDPVTASRSNAAGRYCGVLPGGSGGFLFSQLDEDGNIIWSQTFSTGIPFASFVRSIIIDDSNNCVFIGQGLLEGPISVPDEEIRSNFLLLIDSSGTPQFIRVYDLNLLDGIDCGLGLTRCWISGYDLTNRPTLAKLNTAFQVTDLFYGPVSDFNTGFKIRFTPSGRIAGAFSFSGNGTFFGEPISVPPDPDDIFPQAMTVFQINPATSSCTTNPCTGTNRCCRLRNGANACFSPSVYNCFTGGSQLCPVGTTLCGDACISPDKYTCIGTFLCPLYHFRCGDACYRPSVYSCFDNNFLCPVGTLKCGTACYRPDQFNCCNGQLCPL